MTLRAYCSHDYVWEGKVSGSGDEWRCMAMEGCYVATVGLSDSPQCSETRARVKQHRHESEQRQIMKSNGNL